MKKEIITLLKEHNNDFISGQHICEKLGVSRAAIWKYINQIKHEGYEIEAISKKGYKLVSCPDHLSLEEIEPFLNTKFIGRSVHYFETIDSTNTYAKTIGDKENNNGAIVISEEQVGGRGRLGRSFISPKYKGIWMSIILKPHLNPQAAAKITEIAAASVVLAIRELGIDAKVKWPNDITINGKKLCGILTEMSAELTQINYVIVGIGINVNQNKDDFNNDLKDIATSIMLEKGSSVDRKKLLSAILNNFEALYLKYVENNDFEASLKTCIENSSLIGQDILVINRDTVIEAKTLGIDEDGRLIVQYADGTSEHLISGEVSIRKGSIAQLSDTK